MKSIIGIIIFLFLVLTYHSQTIIYPTVNHQDYEDIVLTKIELSNSNSKFYFRVYSQDVEKSMNWINLDPDTYIEIIDTKEKLKLITIKGLPLSPEKHFFNSKNEYLDYELTFPSIKHINSKINIIECPRSCFNFYQVSLNPAEKQGINKLYYNKKFEVVNRDKAIYYGTFTKDKIGNIIDDFRLYSINDKSLRWKCEVSYVSPIRLLFNVEIGNRLVYVTSGKIIKRKIWDNPKELRLAELLLNRKGVEYHYNEDGYIWQYLEFEDNEQKIEIKYNSSQEIVFAHDLNDAFFYSGNSSIGYELQYYDSFDKNPKIEIFDRKIRDYSAGKVSLEYDGLLMNSKNNGGLANTYNVKFDLNKSDWVVETRFARIGNIEGAGICFGSNETSNIQMFLLSGDSHFKYNNIYNGFNISSLKDWKFDSSIKKGRNYNIMSIMKINDQIYVSVNGETIYNTKYTPVKHNNFSLFVDKSGNSICFDYLSIKQLNITLPEKFLKLKEPSKKTSEFKGNGSGFLVNNSGVFCTNYHVIEGVEEVFVEVDGVDYQCEIVDIDKLNDLAILQVINQKTFNVPYSFNSKKSATGSGIFVLGYPYALSLLGSEVKLTNGIISSQSGFKGDSKTYQISAPIQPGNSGGPLFNGNGNIIGIVSSKFTKGENVGYAIKVEYLLNLLNKNNVNYSKNNTISNFNLVEKVDALRHTTFLVKVK